MAFEDVVTDLPTLPDAEDDRHALGGRTFAREAAAFMFALPEHRIAGILYPWVHSNGMAGSAVCVFGPGMASINERNAEVLVSDDMSFRDWSVNGFTMKLGEPHRDVHLTFKGKRVAIDCRYEASHPVYAFSFHEDGCPAYYADDRTEQHGRVTGTLVVDGVTYSLDTFMQRDHSWGTRIWGLNQHYKWFHATAPDAAVHFFEMQAFGKTSVRGFVVKEGRQAEIRSISYDFTFDENMHHESIDVVAIDSAGRSTTIKSLVFAKFQYDVDPMIVLNEGATTVEIDGVAGTGWCEFCWNRNYYDFAKNFAAEYA